MMRSLFSSVSALKAHQNKMDVIGNNIANVNTVGYKSSRVTFSDVFSETMRGATRPNADTGTGGRNPLQIGLGSTLSSIDMKMTQGATQTTDIPTDLMINGDGFFIVGTESTGYRFTRAGNFRLDVDGTLTNPEGMVLYGWPATQIFSGAGAPTGEYEITQGTVQPINLYSDGKLSTPAQMTTEIIWSGNLTTEVTFPTSPPTISDPIERSLTFYDSLGNEYVMSAEFSLDAGTGRWIVDLGKPTDLVVVNGDSSNPIDLTTVGGAWIAANTRFELQFNSNGYLIDIWTGAGPTATGSTSVSIDFSDIAAEYTAMTGITCDIGNIDLDFSDTTQYKGNTTLVKTYNGYMAGKLESWSIGGNGLITGTYTNGDTRVLGQIALASFLNSAGLEKVGENLYIATVNSGLFDGVGLDPTDIGGIRGGALEMSNVDLASEFTEMITTQRGFQACSRIVSVSDEMIQELVNLKR